MITQAHIMHDQTKLFILHERYAAISIKVVHEQSGKVEYERERLVGTSL